MITPTTGAVKVQVIPEMKGIPFGLKYFDDDHNIYVSQKLFDDIVNNHVNMQYIVMAWKKSSITIQEAVRRLHQEVKDYGLETGQIT